MTATNDFRSIDPVFIPMSDGIRLAARLWLPTDDSQPVPAILEAIPYRRNDGTFLSDHPRYSWWAKHGYAGVRVDIRGSGDSEGLLVDEYLLQEQDDTIEVLAWLEQQPWCTGKVAMIGYSWGGFAGLQVAARQPSQLAAVVTINSVVRRYTDDCHYTGGAVNAHDMLSWATTMFAFDARPPDPAVVGANWQQMWTDRLALAPPMIEPWLSHQVEDDYWRHGSVCFDYPTLTMPIMAVGGWSDPYRNAVLDLVANAPETCVGIIGPWAHGYPHDTTPGPGIDFLGECLQFFDRHLRGDGSAPAIAAPDPAALRVYIQDADDPTSSDRTLRPGRWLALDQTQLGPATGQHVLDIQPGTVGTDSRCGSAAGTWCPYGAPAIAPDQRSDDLLSWCSDSEPLAHDLSILGFGEVAVRVAVDQPLAFIVVRLCEVAADGTSSLISRGVLNLTHRLGHHMVAPVVPGEIYDLSLRLDAAGHRFRAGSTIRVAISPSYWPWIWPSPQPVTMTVFGGQVVLPLLSPDALPCDLGTPQQGAMPLVKRLAPRLSPQQPDFLLGRLHIADLGVDGSGIEVEEGGDNEYSLLPDDPLSARVRIVRRLAISRPGWDTRVEVDAEMTCTETSFVVTSLLTGWNDGAEVFRQTYDTEVARHGG